MKRLDEGIRDMLRSEETQGENRANQVRLSITISSLAVFLVAYVKSGRHNPAGYIIFATLVALLAYALAVRRLLTRDRCHPSIKYLSSAGDITGITTIVIAALFLSSGSELRGWIVSIPVFALFTALSGLRLNASLSVFAGAVSSLEFLILNLFLALAGGEPLPYPQSATIAVLLLAEGGVLALIALRARQLIVRASLAERQQSQLATEASYARSLAETDDLTGLFNRRYFMIALRQHQASYIASQRPYALLVIDLDNFKQINDTYGHPGGDQVIRQVADLLRSNSRATDRIARFGGDEFGVVLSNSGFKSAVMAAERLCRATREHLYRVEGEIPPFHMSLSIGLACCPDDATDVENLLRAADSALYKAKASGRDCVVSAKS